MSRRTTAYTSTEQSLPTEVLDQVAESDPSLETDLIAESDATTGAGRRLGRHRPPAGLRRPALLLAVAAAGGIMVNVFTAGQPAAEATAAADQPVSVASQLGMSSQQTDAALT